MMKKFYLLVFIFHLTSPSIIPQSHTSLSESFLEYQSLKKTSRFHIIPTLIGPVLNSARVESVQAVQSKPGTIYTAFGSGNLWKTVNHGITWKPLFENQPAQGIGDIAIAPSNPEIIYLGTGETLRKNRNFTMPGNGVYRSSDGGENWSHIGLEDVWHIGEIAIHPKNPEVAFVAAMGRFWTNCDNRGIYRTQNGGLIWDRVLTLDHNTRAVDVVIAHSNPEFIYAAAWGNDIKLPLAESVYGPESGVYKSTDGGDSWERIFIGMELGQKTGRIGLAVSHSNPNKVYALVDNLNKRRAIATEVYRTTNGGNSWERTHEDELSFMGTIGWYFSDIYLNPQNDEEIFALGIRLARSSNGGKSFSLIGGEIQHVISSPAQTLHLDQCELWINPDNPNHLILGNDGGLYVSYTKGANWIHYNNIPAGEFYHITLDNEKPYKVFGGTQDNATVFGPAKEWDRHRSDSWQYLWIDAWSGGDGCVTQVDPDDPNTVYFSAQNAWILRKNMNTGISKRITGNLNKLHPDLQFNFVAPYTLSNHDSKILYLSGNYTFKTEDRGENWKIISPDLSFSSDSLRKAHAAGAISESPINRQLLYVGTDKGQFWCTEDGGLKWYSHSTALPIAYIRSICPSQYEESRVYLAMTGLNRDDLNSYLFLSEDHGKNWRSISSNLPGEPANVILEDPFFERIIYVGTMRGVYISLNLGKSWELLSTRIPAVSISDLKIQNREKDLIIATHGRGIYKMELEPLYEAISNLDDHSKGNVLLEVGKILQPKLRDTHGDVELASVEKLNVYFYLDKDEEVLIQLKDSGEKEIFRQEITGMRGLNHWQWDLVLGNNQSKEPYFFRYKDYLMHGLYTLNLILEDEVLSGQVDIAKRSQ